MNNYHNKIWCCIKPGLKIKPIYVLNICQASTKNQALFLGPGNIAKNKID